MAWLGYGQGDRGVWAEGVAGSVTAETLVAEQFQPVAMGLAGEQLGRGFADALRAIATNQTAMIQKESQQVEVAMTNVAAQEKVIAQATVDIFDDGTGARRLGHGLLDGLLNVVQGGSEFLI